MLAFVRERQKRKGYCVNSWKQILPLAMEASSLDNCRGILKIRHDAATCHVFLFLSWHKNICVWLCLSQCGCGALKPQPSKIMTDASRPLLECTVSPMCCEFLALSSVVSVSHNLFTLSLTAVGDESVSGVTLLRRSVSPFASGWVTVERNSPELHGTFVFPSWTVWSKTGWYQWESVIQTEWSRGSGRKHAQIYTTTYNYTYVHVHCIWLLLNVNTNVSLSKYYSKNVYSYFK